MSTIFYFKDSAIPLTISGIADEIFSSLRIGVLQEQIITIDYFDANNEASIRDALPEVIFCFENDWFLAAFCYLRDEQRTFRIDRIEAVELTERHDQSHGVAAGILKNGLPWFDKTSSEKGYCDELDNYLSPVTWTRIQAVPGEKTPYSATSSYWDIIQNAENGDLQQIRENIAAGADVNCRTGSGSMPLLSAARYGRFEVVKFLIEQGADPLAKNCNGYTPLIDASRGKNMELIKYLLEEKNSDIHAQTSSGWTPLYLAVLDAQIELLRYYLESGADVNVRTRKRETVLMLAVGSSFASDEESLEIARILIEAGADVNAQDKSGDSALVHAINRGNPQIVNFLLESGASCRLRDNKGNTPLLRALQNFNASSIYPGINGNSPRPCTDDILPTLIRSLVAHGVDVNAGNRDGITPVMIAGLSIMRYLISCGADVHAKTNTGKTVAMFHAKDIRTLRFLAECGADILERDQGGDSVLLLAPTSYRVTRYLIEEYGFSVNEKNQRNETILHHACDASHLRLVQYLISHGANINVKDAEGKTPLDYLDEKFYYEDSGDYDEEIVDILNACSK